MRTSDTKLNDLCEGLDGCKLDAEKKISDKELFKHPPSIFGDCPICFLQLPSFNKGWKYMTCCGKVICSGCIHAPVYDDLGNVVTEKKCPFCRSPLPDSDEGIVKRYEKRVEANDPIAIFNHGNYYRDGRNGFPRDDTKALELWHRASELGYAVAYNNIGYSYEIGRGVEIDKNKAAHYYELAAIGGDEVARYNLALDEKTAGNIQRALKHFIIAVRSGDDESLKEVKQLFTNGHATKDDYTKALRLYQAYLGEIKSRQRDEAAAFDSERYRYY